MKKKTYLTSFILFIFFFSGNNAFATALDSFIWFFEVQVEISKQYPPAYNNAGNGWFRDKLVTRFANTGMGECADSVVHDQNRPTLDDIYAFFAYCNYRAFKSNENAKASPGQIINITLSEYEDEIYSLASAIAGVITHSPETVASAAINLATLLITHTKKETSSGKHLNGHIQGYAADGAKWTQKFLREFDPHNEVEVKMKAILQNTFVAIEGLRAPTSPWLHSKWQIEYTVILDSAAKALRTLR